MHRRGTRLSDLFFSFASGACLAFGTPVVLAQDATPPPAQDNKASTPTTVGEKPELPQEAPEALDVFEERGALTKKGTLVIEPSFSFSHSDANRIAIEGFTVAPALLIGNIDVSEVRRDSYIGALSFRLGITNRMEIETRVPYVYREDEVRTRPFLMASGLDEFSETDGSGIGDVEAAIRFQLTSGLGKLPILISNLRVKSDTGEGPFDVDREVVQGVVPVDPSDPDCVGTNPDPAVCPTMPGPALGQTLKEQPTGSGFWSIEPSITAIVPTDPAVLFGNVSYTFNLEEDTDEFGTIDPGDFFGIDLGVGLSLNEKLSITFGYDHTVVFETEGFSGLENEFEVIHVGNFLFGTSYRLTPKFSIVGSLGIGLTDDSPDLTVSLRLPYRMPVFNKKK